MKEYKLFDLLQRRQLLADFLQGLVGFELGAKHDAIGFVDRVDFGFVETAPFHPLDVETMQLGAVAGSIAKRRHILGNHRAGAENRPRTDPHKLMNTRPNRRR